MTRKSEGGTSQEVASLEKRREARKGKRKKKPRQKTVGVVGENGKGKRRVYSPAER